MNRKEIYSFAFLGILLDQILKNIAINLGFENNHTIIPKLISFHLAINKGAAFSLLTNFPSTLAIISLIFSGIMIIWIWQNKIFNRYTSIYLIFLLAGTLGNGIDRWRLGYVIDFIKLEPFDFPIFNFADIYINLAIMLIIFESIFLKIHNQNN